MYNTGQKWCKFVTDDFWN